MGSRTIHLICAVFALQVIIPLSSSLHSKDSQAPPAVIFDDSPGLGRQFEGIGAISGGGVILRKLYLDLGKKFKEN